MGVGALLSLLKVILGIASQIFSYIERKNIEAGAEARLILKSWAKNDAFVSKALAAGEAKRVELDTDPSKLHERDPNYKDD